jgi:ABC-type phosphate transport system substrate-binding protein
VNRDELTPAEERQASLERRRVCRRVVSEAKQSNHIDAAHSTSQVSAMPRWMQGWQGNWNATDRQHQHEGSEVQRGPVRATGSMAIDSPPWCT